MEARAAKLEASVEHIERDIGKYGPISEASELTQKQTFAFYSLRLLPPRWGLPDLMAKGFHWL